MLRTAHFSRSVRRSIGLLVGRRDEKLSAASAAAVAAVASSGDEERDECLPNNVVFVVGGGGVEVEVVVRVKVVVLSVAESSSSGHSRKFPHKVGGSASLSRGSSCSGGNLGESVVVVMPQLKLKIKMHFTLPQTIVGSAAAALQ